VNFFDGGGWIEVEENLDVSAHVAWIMTALPLQRSFRSFGMRLMDSCGWCGERITVSDPTRRCPFMAYFKANPRCA